MNSTVRFNDTEYRVIETTEEIDGTNVLMYGVVGIKGNETVMVPGLSDSPDRIEELVNKMNDGGLELCQLRDVVEDFLAECYGSVII